MSGSNSRVIARSGSCGALIGTSPDGPRACSCFCSWCSDPHRQCGHELQHCGTPSVRGGDWSENNDGAAPGILPACSGGQLANSRCSRRWLDAGEKASIYSCLFRLSRKWLCRPRCLAPSRKGSGRGWTDGPPPYTLTLVEVMMLPMTSRLGVLVLLICDYWGDPGLALSPLARPFCSTPTSCPSLILRKQVEQAIGAPPQTPAPPPWEVGSACLSEECRGRGPCCQAVSAVPSPLGHLFARLQP
jgi:hypothetical protein